MHFRPATDADAEAENAIIATLRAAFPAHAILGETAHGEQPGLELLQLLLEMANDALGHTVVDAVEQAEYERVDVTWYSSCNRSHTVREIGDLLVEVELDAVLG